MAKHTKKTTETTEDLYLFVKESRKDGYYHQTAQVVTNRFESHEWVPYGVNDTYDGPLYSGLRASCQGDEQSATRVGEPVYGFTVEYRDHFAADLRAVRRMLKMLESIEKGMAKMQEKRGYVRTWGEYCGRLAEVLGCKGIVIEKSRDAVERVGYRYDFLPLGEGINRVNNMVWQWRRTYIERDERASA